jgi:curli biogenesis system outer membrane secretion channel CsgG
MGLFAVLAFAGCQSSSVTKEEDDVTLKPRPPRPREARPLVAVVEFADKTNYGQGQLGNCGTEVLITGLSESEQVRLLERTAINKVLDELKLQHSGVTDAATASQVGRMLNAKYIIIGAVTMFGQHVEANSFVLVHNKTQICECTVDVRLVEVQTAEILYSTSGKGKATKGVSGSIVGGGRSSFDQTLAEKAFRAAIYRMIDKMMDKMD